MWELRDGHSDSDRLLKYYIDEICSWPTHKDKSNWFYSV